MGTTIAGAPVFVTGYRIAFLCGRTQEPWSPLSVRTGIGGSQEALIAMAAALQRLGHSVRVYNSCAAAAGEYDGVVYEDYRAFHRKPSVDLVVVWRWPWLARSLPAGIPAWLWLSEAIDPGPVAAAAHRFRKIVVLSRFHREHYHALPDEKFFRSRNGIHPEHFDEPVERNPYKVVYASSYDRGLLPLLEAWPRVKAAVPEAHLTVFYGFEAARARSFELIRRQRKTWRKLNPVTYWRYRRSVEAAMRRANAEHLGRIGHPDVARQLLSAGIWAYPTASTETSCITAMKAQAAGAVPVVIPSGAVGETVQFGAKTSTSANDYPGRRLPSRVYDEWEALLISLLQDSAKLDPLRARMAAAARQMFAWETVAHEWNAEFARTLTGEAGAQEATDIRV
jgi:glycosyltransferase involved in cell wall biosynthesis